MQEIHVPSLGQKEPLEKEMATYSSILAWEILWIEQLRSCGCKTVRHNLATKQQHQISPTSFSVHCWLLPESTVTIMGASSDFITPFFHIHFLAFFWFCLFSFVFYINIYYFIWFVSYIIIIYFHTHTHTKLLQSCPTLRDHIDCSLPASSVHGIFQAKILEWVAISFSYIYVYIMVAPKLNNLYFTTGYYITWKNFHLFLQIYL